MLEVVHLSKTYGQASGATQAIGDVSFRRAVVDHEELNPVG